MSCLYCNVLYRYLVKKKLLTYFIVFNILEMARSKASGVKHRSNRGKERVEAARDNSCLACFQQFNKTTRKVKSICYCTHDKCICISCFDHINAEKNLHNRCGCNIYFSYDDYDPEYRQKNFFLIRKLRFNYMNSYGDKCHSLLTNFSYEHTANNRGVHYSVKKIRYTGCDHLTCNSCAHDRIRKGLNHYVCGVCFSDLDLWSPPPGGGYCGQVIALRTSNSVTSISSDFSISSDSD